MSLQVRNQDFWKVGSYIWASSRENLSSGFPISEFQTCLLGSWTSQKIEILPVASLHIILSTKALIRLPGHAGWSAPVLFANP